MSETRAAPWTNSSFHRAPCGLAKRALSSDDRVIFGVCGQIAHTIGVDPAVVRLGAIVLTLVGVGWTIPAYVIAHVVMKRSGIVRVRPASTWSSDVAEATRRASRRTMVLLGWMLVLGAGFLALQVFNHWINTTLVAALVMLVIGINVVLRHRD